MILQTFTEVIDAIEKMLETYKTSLEEQTTTEIVKEKKDLKKASNLCEKILEITDKYKNTFDKKDLSRYNKLRDKFFKVN